MENWGSYITCIFADLVGNDWSEEQYGVVIWRKITSILEETNGNGITVLLSSINDRVQAYFFALMGGAEVEASGLINDRAEDVATSTFIFSGDDHCSSSISMLLQPASAGHEDFLPFLNELFTPDENNGGSYLTSPPANHLCAECGDESTKGCDGIIGSVAVTNHCGVCCAAKSSSEQEFSYSYSNKEEAMEVMIDGGDECLCEAVIPAWVNELDCRK
jgi:hypothetical protein